VITSAQEDINDAGTEGTPTFTGNVGAPDANGRSAVTLHFNHDSHYATYLVSRNEVVLVPTDSGVGLVTATELRRSGTLGNGIFSGKAVGRESRMVNNNGTEVNDASIYLISFDGRGNLSFTGDENRGGTLTLQAMQSGTYSVNASTGRTTISGGGGSICYPVQQNEAFCVEATSGHPGLLFFQAQAAGPFNTGSLDGQYLGGSLPQYVPTTDDTIDALFLDGIGNGGVTYSQTGPDPPLLNQTGTGTYSIDATGHLTLNVGGSPVVYGYVVGPDRFFGISTNDDPRTLIHQKSAAP